MVILITYGMKYFTMEAVSKDSILAKTRASVHMWNVPFQIGHVSFPSIFLEGNVLEK